MRNETWMSCKARCSPIMCAFQVLYASFGILKKKKFPQCKQYVKKEDSVIVSASTNFFYLNDKYCKKLHSTQSKSIKVVLYINMLYIYTHICMWVCAHVCNTMIMNVLVSLIGVFRRWRFHEVNVITRLSSLLP